MDANSLKAKKQRLKLEINKSLTRVRLSNNGKLTLADKQRIKNAAASSVQRFLKSEIKKTSVKTYDWYFYKQEGHLYHIEVSRNNVLQNRYFIVDYKQIPIEAKTAFASTYGQQNVQQYDISSKEISDIISSSKKIFADMMKITVSEKEDAKIYRAFNNVDEKKIITVTVGLPLAIIASAEAVPLMVMASKSNAASTLLSSGRSLFSLSTKGAGTRMAYETGSEFLSAGGDIGRMNLLGIGASAFSSNLGADFVGSKYSYSFNKGFESFTMEDTAIRLGAGKVGLGIKSGLGRFSNVFGNNGAIKAMNISFTLAGQTGTKLIVNEHSE